MKTNYAHVSLSLEESLISMYSFGRIHPNNPLSGGFVQENLYEGVFKKFSACECAVYRLKITEQQYSALSDEILRFMVNRDCYKYNFLGLFAAGMNVPLKRRNRYFCSQFVSELLIRSCILTSQNPPELVRPTDLLQIESKEKIFEGLTQAYMAPVKLTGVGTGSMLDMDL